MAEHRVEQTPIRRLMVANRGEIARRIIRAARRLGIETVGLYSDADADSLHVGECDLAVRLPGRSAAETYLDVAAVVAAARRAGADAVHPGYGFLSENADAAEAVIDAGLTWVGPTPAAMRVMASKLEAKRVVDAAGVPVLPSARIDGDDQDSWATVADEVGYPLLVKASAGGGGRGMRLVESPDALIEAVSAARREAAAAFGDDTLYAERFVRRGRHVEVQVVADRAGTVLHAFERECSLQRRHQKILEESPSPGTHPDVLGRMYDAAVATARAVGYTSLGTVEFLLDDPDASTKPGSDPEAHFYFLEMNTRLQVEHPVTELVTGLDLVEAQLRVAAGEPLSLAQLDIARTGHAVEARLVAEDPSAGWVPSSGRLLRFEQPDVPGVRWDTAVATCSTVSPYYDSLIAKVIAHGATRVEALDRLRAALRGLRIHGVATNRDALLAIIDHRDVRAGRTTIDLLESSPDDFVGVHDERVIDRHALIAACAAHAERDAARPTRRIAPAGWRSMADAVETIDLGGPYERSVSVCRGRGGDLVCTVDGREPGVAIVHSWDGEHLDLELDGLRQRASVLLGAESDETARATHVFADGMATTWTEPARLPAGEGSESARGPSSPVPGTIVAVHVSPGDVVSLGDCLVVLEAMKMEHRITADADASVVEVVVAVGDAVDAHEVLVVLEPLDSSENEES